MSAAPPARRVSQFRRRPLGEVTHAEFGLPDRRTQTTNHESAGRPRPVSHPAYRRRKCRPLSARCAGS
jgi:hypothetical protein